MSTREPARLLFLDSCAIVNLYASAHFESIVDTLDGVACIVDYVERESQFIRNRLESGEEEKEPIRLNDPIDAGWLQVHILRTEQEFELFLSLALRLDDGEAATLALAAVRDGTIVTDDRKALSIATELSVPALTTPEVIHRWAMVSGRSEQTICEALENIRFRARYEPGKRHPLWSWWQAVLDSRHLT